MRRIAALLLLSLPLTALAQTPGPPEQHWSLRPRTQPAVPCITDPLLVKWVRNPIDAFILDKLAKTILRQAPEADRSTLIRRLTFDLTGLPSTQEEVAAFIDDPAPDAYERLVDRLLVSPHYGERWGRHWLDVVRFAETEGFEYDRHRPGAWHYRDYVIQSFNDDKPYDRFVLEQLAGDEIDADNPELLVAAGFHRLGPVRRNAGNQSVAFSRNEVLTEMTAAIGATFLGLRMASARGQDHKFDPITQTDYYRLQAFLAATQEKDVVLADAKTQSDWIARTEQIKKEIKKLQTELKDRGDDDRQQVQSKIVGLQKSLPPELPTISTVQNVEKERTEIHVLKRGDPDRPGPQVAPRAVSALLPADTPELPADATNPRTALATWLNDPDHPLTARVMVN